MVSCGLNSHSEVDILNHKAENLMIITTVGDKNLDSAIVLLKLALSKDSVHKKSYANLATAFSLKGEHEPAVKIWKKFTDIFPDDIGANFFYGMELLCTNRKNESKFVLLKCVKWYKKKINSTPTKEDITTLAWIYILLEEKEIGETLLMKYKNKFVEVNNFLIRYEGLTPRNLLPCWWPHN